jgi:RES domain-containing protein
MVVWRVARKAHTARPLSGEGARLYGGRWNHIGVPIAYTSQSLSLAVLEYLVNLSIADLPEDLFSIRIEIPDDFARSEIALDELPDTWRTYPAVEELKDIGTNWARKGDTPVLLAPSVVIPDELNCLINPMHARKREIVVDRVEPFALDERLFKKRSRARKR